MSGCTTCIVPSEHNKIPGCRNNGGCLTDGCDKLSVTDWLSDMELPTGEQFNIVEV